MTQDDMSQAPGNKDSTATAAEIKPLDVKLQPAAVPDSDVNGERPGTGFWNVVQSVGAAMLGVQSRKNRERDFTQGKPIHFIIGGLIGTAVFLLVVWLIVQYLLLTS